MNTCPETGITEPDDAGGPQDRSEVVNDEELDSFGPETGAEVFEISDPSEDSELKVETP